MTYQLEEFQLINITFTTKSKQTTKLLPLQESCMVAWTLTKLQLLIDVQKNQQKDAGFFMKKKRGIIPL